LFVLELGSTPWRAAAADSGSTAAIDDEFSHGEQAWRASCPKPTEDGSCLEPRDPALVGEARRRFLTVQQRWRRRGNGLQQPRTPPAHVNYAELFRADPGMDPKDAIGPAEPGAAHAAAGAAFYLAEAEWEAFARLKPRRGLNLPRYFPEADFLEQPPPKWTPQVWRRFKPFLTRKLDQLAYARRLYLTAFASREAPFDVAAAARIGQLYQLFDRDIPGEVLDDKAAAAFEKCFDMSAKRVRYDEWFRLCVHELTVLKPVEFPKAHEVVPEESVEAAGISLIPVVTRLE
jgi:hypothetical protein